MELDRKGPVVIILAGMSVPLPGLPLPKVYVSATRRFRSETGASGRSIVGAFPSVVKLAMYPAFTVLMGELSAAITKVKVGTKINWVSRIVLSSRRISSR